VSVLGIREGTHVKCLFFFFFPLTFGNFKISKLLPFWILRFSFWQNFIHIIALLNMGWIVYTKDKRWCQVHHFCKLCWEGRVMTYVSRRERFVTLGCLGETLLAKCTSHALGLSNLWLEKSGFLKARSHQLVNFFSFLKV